MLPAFQTVMGKDHVLNTDTPGTMLDVLHTSAPFMTNNYDRGMITHILLIQAHSAHSSPEWGLTLHHMAPGI